MEPNWSPMRYSPVNDDDISGFVSNAHPDISGVHGTVAHDGNEMDLGLVPYTQPDSAHTGQTLYSTNHYAGSELGMHPMGIYPNIFPTPEQFLPEGSDYGWFAPGSTSGLGYMKGLESSQRAGAVYSEYPERVFNTMNLDNNHNLHRSMVQPSGSSFNRAFFAVYGMGSKIHERTPIHGHGAVYAQTLNFHLDQALTIPTSAMPNSMPLPALAPTLPPLITTGPIIPTTTPMTVADYDHNYGRDHDHDRNTPEGKTSKNERRKYRISYDNHASHRYTCHACRFSTDVKRDFVRHKDTGKHRKRKLQQGGQQEEVHHTREQQQGW
ncbi:hypothetical protein N0V85_009057 [Neurospora sp. IMI 360204]|nr:hypothetical protein N0V85_009057 [Neurospora sp. IMI 360204]